MTFDELNAMDRASFVGSLGHLFEHSPWVAEETFDRRPFRDAEHLHRALCATMRAATDERKLALIGAHPDLAGRLARQGALTAASAREQASAGLDRLAAAEQNEIEDLNARYRERFGFPFILCARLSNKDGILAALRLRVSSTREAEIETALAEIEKIARLRLADVIGEG